MGQSRVPHVSIVIPHFNQPEQLYSCLQSLSHQACEGGLEIIVVDNGSSQLPDPGKVAGFGAQLLQEPIAGPGPARNTGAGAASGEVLLFIDADCRPHADWVAAATHGLRRPECLGVIGGDVQIDFVDPTQPNPMEAYEAVFAFRQKLYIESHGYSGTGNLAMTRGVWEKVGPFAGIGIIYAPEMIVYHPARKGFGELENKWRRHIGHGAAELRAGGSKVKWLVKAAIVLASTVPHSFQLLASSRVTGLVAKLRGIGILARIRWFRFVTMLRASRKNAVQEGGDWAR
jgi:glycosyltransferase involved in cell wall biosynthesis